SGEDLQARRGLLRVTEAWPAAAVAVPLGAPLPELRGDERGRLIEVPRAARLRVSLHPYDAPVAAALAPSSYLEGPPASGTGELQLRREGGGGWLLPDDADGDGTRPGEPALPLPPARQPESLQALAEQYLRWTAPLRLARGCTDLPHRLRVELMDCRA